MDQLMSGQAVYSAHISPNKSKDKPATPGVSVFVFEQKAVLSSCQWVVITHNAKTPKPSETVIYYENVQRPEETLVLLKNSFTIFAEIRFCLTACDVPNLPAVWHIKNIS